MDLAQNIASILGQDVDKIEKESLICKRGLGKWKWKGLKY